MNKTAIIGTKIFDGISWHIDSALLLNDGVVSQIVPLDDVPQDAKRFQSAAAFITPGFIDLQVNGGGGVMLNDAPTLASIQTICAAHLKAGTTGLLPTLITDRPSKVEQAIEAATEAQAAKVPGFLGLHLEGPHLSVAKKGAHDAALIRDMTSRDCDVLCQAAQQLNILKVTIAPESVSLEQLHTLMNAGVHVSLGHSHCSYETGTKYLKTGSSSNPGAVLATHLFNAMSQFGHRDPGLVGAVLNAENVSCGLIADGHHVSTGAIQLALRAKKKSGHIYLVTDAMGIFGTDITSFEIDGRKVERVDGRLTLEDGTLAGADIDMSGSIRFLTDKAHVPFQMALKMASTFPARAIDIDAAHGHLQTDAKANFVELDENYNVLTTWLDGQNLS